MRSLAIGLVLGAATLAAFSSPQPPGTEPAVARLFSTVVVIPAGTSMYQQQLPLFVAPGPHGLVVTDVLLATPELIYWSMLLRDGAPAIGIGQATFGGSPAVNLTSGVVFRAGSQLSLEVSSIMTTSNDLYVTVSGYVF